MKVAFCAFDAESYVSGPNSWLQQLLPRLCERDAEPRVLCVSATAEGGPMVRALRGESIEVSVLPWPAPTRRTVRRILDDLAHRPPDVFVPNLLVAGFIAGRTVRDAGIATVGVLHSDDDFHRAVFHRFVAGPKAFRLSSLVCVSRYLEERVTDSVPADTVVRRIPYGVPVPATCATPPGDQLTLAYVGRLVEAQKCVVATARGLCRAAREVERTRAVMYGDGPERPRVEEVLRRDAPDGAVKLAGAVPSDAVQRHLLDAHVLVLLSDYEGLPIALMEAMACGVVPVCLATASGVPELVEHEVTGLLVSDRDDDFVEAVRRLRADGALWRRLSAAARERVSREYTADRGASLWWELIRDLGSSARAASPPRVPFWPRLPAFDHAFAREDFRWRPLPLRLAARLTGRATRWERTNDGTW